jgi:hypothetical protein
MKVTDNNRAIITHSYIRAIVDSMDMDALIEIAMDTLENNLKEYTNEQLENEIGKAYPEILENV